MPILWSVTHPILTGAELFDLTETSQGFRLRGWVVAAVEDIPCTIEYQVAVDRGWVSRRADLAVESGRGRRTMTVEHDGRGGWSVDGLHRPDLDGCTDLDLGVSPSTNTLPIRRLELEVGGVGNLVAAWVRFPELVVDLLPQSYERMGGLLYRYRSDSFQADIEVDEQGIVLRYGSELWRVAARD